MTPPLVRALAAATAEGARVYLVSDRLDLATDMRSSFLAERGADAAAALFSLHPLHAGEAASAEGWCPAGRRTRKEGQPAAAAAEGAEAAQQPPPPPGGWLRMRPYLLPTERDKVCEKLARPAPVEALRALTDSTRPAVAARLPHAARAHCH